MLTFTQLGSEHRRCHGQSESGEYCHTRILSAKIAYFVSETTTTNGATFVSVAAQQTDVATRDGHVPLTCTSTRTAHARPRAAALLPGAMASADATMTDTFPPPPPITPAVIDAVLLERIIARDLPLKRIATNVLSLVDGSAPTDAAAAADLATTTAAELSAFEQTTHMAALTAAAAARAEARAHRQRAAAEAAAARLAADLDALRQQLAAAEAEAARRAEYAARERVIGRLPPAPALAAALRAAQAELGTVHAAERVVGERVRKAEREARLLLRCVEDFEWSVDAGGADEAVPPSLRGGGGWARVRVPELDARAEAAAAAEAAAKAAAEAAGVPKVGWASRPPLVPEERAGSPAEEEDDSAMDEVY